MLTKESTLSPAQTSEVDVDVSQSSTLEHLLPDASFLLYGVFSQSGFDLEITNPNGINHVVPDYFSFPTPPNLMIESGAGLSPAMVKSLFPRALGQDVLFAGPAPSGAALVEIGSVKLVVGTVTVRHADGSQEAVKKGAVLYQGDVLVTGSGSFVKAEMRDGTKFQLGQNGEAALDQFEFDEAADVGRFEATVRVGGFYYKSGKIGELPSASAEAHTQLNTPTSIIGVRGSELEGSVDQSGETVVVHRSGVLEITDINGDNAVTLDIPGNTAIIVLNGQPAFTAEPTPAAQQALQQSLPPPDGSVAEEEAVEADAEEVAEEVVEEAVAEAEEAVDESTEEEAVEEVVEEVAEEVAEEVEEAELDEAADAEEEAEETSDEEDLDSLGVDESSVESQSDAENAEDVASNEGEGEAVESSDDEALSTFTNPDTSVESATEDVDTTLETLQSQDSNVEGQDSGELQTLGVASTNIEESVAEVEDVVAEESQEVIAPDNPPEALADEITVLAGGAIDVTEQLLGNDSDPDTGQVLAIISVDSARPDAVTLVDGRVQFQPDESLLQSLSAGETTTETLSYTVGSGTSKADADVVIVYQGSNDAPVANNDVAETNEDVPLVLAVISNDSDPDLADTLVITSVDGSTALGVITITDDGQSLLYEPSQSLGEGSVDDVFSYTISDGNTTATATVTVTVVGVNDPPVLVSDPTGFTLELVPEAGEISIPLDAIFADADLGSTLTVLALDTEFTRGAVRIGSVLYDPGDAFDYLKEGEIGIEQFGITVQDEFGQTGQGVFSFQIEGINDAPVAVANTNEVPENGVIGFAAVSSVLGDDADVDGDALTVSSIRTGNVAATGGAQGEIGSTLVGAYGVLTLNADGQYSYTTTASAVDGLAAGATAVDVFTYTITDGALSASAELLITVTGVNDAPVAVADTLDATEDTPETYTAAQLVGNDTDVENSDLSLSSVTSGSNGTAVLNADGTVTFTPNADYAGAADFTYIVNDGTADATSAATVTVNVGAVNDAPVAVANTNEVPENGVIGFAAVSSVLGDAADVDGDALTVSSIRTGNVAATGGAQGEIGSTLVGAYGVLTLNADGQYRYATTASAVDGLAAGATAVDVFTYTITDGALSASAELLITVTGVNDAPVAVADTLDATEDTPETYTAAQLVGNDTDVENSDLSLSSVTSGSNGTAVLNADGTVTFTPNADYAGAADFTYIVNDGTADATSAATVTVNVGAVNDAPVAVANTNEVPENGVIGFAAVSSVLGDAADVDGDALTVSSIRTGNVAATDGAQGEIGSTLVGAYGVLTLNADGQYSYTTTASAVDGLAAGATAVDVFTYTITDGALSASAELLITVTGVNDAPVAVANTNEVPENGVIGFAAVSSVLGDAADVDGDALTVSSIRTGNVAATGGAQGEIGSTLVGAYGVLTLNADGQYRYATTASAADGLAAGATAVDVFTYTITDGALSASAELLITVTGVNDAPVLAGAGGTLSFTEDGSATVIDSAVSLSDVDDTNIASATITISSGHVSSEDVLAFTNTSEITGSWDSSAGELTLSGDATTAQYEAALETVTYQNTNTDDPNNGSRTVSWVVNDGTANSSAITSTISVSDVNDAPVLEDAGGTVIFSLGIPSIEGGTSTGTSSTGTSSYTTVIDSSLAVSDVDDVVIEGATISISSGFVLGEDELDFTNTSEITGEWDSENGVLTLSGNATKAQYEAALESIIYSNLASSGATVGTRTITWRINDGDTDGSAATSFIRFNASPTLTGAGGTLPFSEGDSAAVIESALSLSDDDDANIASATITISSGHVSSEDVLAFTNTPEITGSWDSSTGELTLSGNATKAQYEAALETVTYRNTNTDDPNNGTRTVSWVVNDGAANSSAITSTISVTAVNDAPVLAGAGLTVSYTLFDAAIAIDSTLVVSDVDDVVIEGATISISSASGVDGNDDFLEFNDTPEITGSWDGTNGVLTLSGNATKAQYEAALESIAYSNSSESPSAAGMRTITWIINDGEIDSGSYTSFINVVAPEGGFAFTGPEDFLGYGMGDSAPGFLGGNGAGFSSINGSSVGFYDAKNIHYQLAFSDGRFYEDAPVGISAEADVAFLSVGYIDLSKLDENRQSDDLFRLAQEDFRLIEFEKKLALESVDFSNLDQLTSVNQLDVADKIAADSLTLTFADIFELVGDNSLDAYVPANDHKVLMINGDSEDALMLNGVDIRNQTAVQTDIDLYGDGTTYALFQDTDLGVDVYVLSDLLSGASPSGSEKVSEPVMAAPTFDQYLYEPSADHFGGL